MPQGLYLGKEVDPRTGTLGARLDLDPTDLLTHGLIVGMTGSGKTGLAIALIEEALKQGVPVIAIDPKGDLGNLLLLFESLDAASFAPWIDPEAARREGKDVQAAAAEVAAAWKKGLAEWGLSGADVAAQKKCREATIYTPGSTAGVPLNILQSLEAPSLPFESAEEDLRDEIAGIVSGLLGLLRIEADPLRSREYILLTTLIERAWRAGKGLSLETLIPAVVDPPFEKLGALSLESVYPRKERNELAMALNNLLASPGFATWREGEPLDVARLLHAADGRPRLSIVYTAHLSDEERLFVTALLLDKVKTWMRQQGGTSQLRALIYMDEIYGYFPPHPANPPTKRPLLTLLKQARAQGVGVVLATQNPVDLDYKGLANMGVWMVGRLQTSQDRARLKEGLLDAGMNAGRLDTLLDATRKRVFLLHDVHRSAPVLLHSRWALSYLRGPLTREEIGRLMAGGEARPVPRAPAGEGAEAGPPVLPAPFHHSYFSRYGGELADPYVLVKYAVRYKDAGETVAVRAYPLGGSSASEVLESEPVAVEESALTPQPAKPVRHADLPGWFAATGARGIEKALKERLPDKLALTLWYDPVTKAVSQAGEDKAAFAARLQAGGGGTGAKIQDKLERKRRELATAEQELAGRKTEKWAALGTAILSNIGLVTGRKRTITGAGSVLTKNRMENTAESRV
ncbi:MAG TPA: helicase HerA-like domain-containing protein, partial [Vicinamibacteria bacterium]|nr:helicase HerA-like domain-containing protein [Vicinamibacteria bacterium]